MSKGLNHVECPGGLLRTVAYLLAYCPALPAVVFTIKTERRPNVPCPG